MAKVAIEMVKKSGVDVDKLLELLVKNAAAELTTDHFKLKNTLISVRETLQTHSL
jgi:ferritin-like protein